MDKEMKKEHDDQEPEYTSEKLYNQLNAENKRKIDQLTVKWYMEQVSEGKG